MVHDTFAPAVWLDRWEAAGGGWYVREGQPVWCYLRGQEKAVSSLLIETYQRGRVEAIDAEMLSRHAAREPQPAE